MKGKFALFGSLGRWRLVEARSSSNNSLRLWPNQKKYYNSSSSSREIIKLRFVIAIRKWKRRMIPFQLVQIDERAN